MSIKLNIRGFQSIKNSIEIVVDGYCVIEGESNLGKSAVVRGTHAALFNRMGTEFITEDEPACEVIIESMGHTIKWHKDHKSTFYEVDGVKINKPGRGVVPDEVRAAGLYAIKTLDKELHWPQIHFQWDQPFIIGSYNGVIAAELLGASQDTVKISRAIKLVNADVTKCKTGVSFLEKQNNELATTVGKMEEVAGKLNALQCIVDQIETFRNDTLKKEYMYGGLIKRYKTYWIGWKISSEVVKVSVPVILDVSYYERFVNLYRRYTQTYSLVEISSKNQGVVPEIPDGRECIREFTRLYKELSLVSKQIQVMGQVVSISQPQRFDFQGVVSRIQLLKNLQGQFLQIQKDLDSSVRLKGEIDVELKKISEERDRIGYLVNSIERCPLCSAPMRNGVYCLEEGSDGRIIKDKSAQVGITGRSSQTVS